MFIKRVIQALEANGIDYALVGGYAVALHGAVRGTVDIDLVITRSRDAYTRAEAALRQIGLQSRLPVKACEVFDFREEYIRNRNLTAWSFINPDNPLEIVDIIITEDAGKLAVVERHAFGKTLRVASIPDLVRMKRQSGRPQDLEDIRALERIT